MLAAPARFLLFLVPALLLLGLLFFWLRPTAAPVPSAERAAHAPGGWTGAPDHVLRVQVVNRQRVAGPAVLRLTRHERLLLVVTADEPGSLHLHGYDLQVAVQPRQPAALRLVAEYSGRFPFEFHAGEAEVVLGALEIYPP